MGISLGNWNSIRVCLCAAALVPLVAACQPGDSIDEGGQAFDRISEDATITLLGNEPFWNIEIAPEGGSYRATYTTPENTDGSSFPLDRFAGNNGLGFSGEFAGGSVQIALTPGLCKDTMSDRSYPYTATVVISNTTLFGCGYTSDEPFEGYQAA